MNDNDKRVMKTKQSIREAFFKQLAEKGIERMTVKAILDDAGLNRTTFYAYYTDKYDLLEKTQEGIMNQIIRIKRDNPVGGGKNIDETEQYVRSYFLALFKYIQANHQVLQLLFANQNQIAFLKDVTHGRPEFYNHWRPVVSQVPGIDPRNSYAALVGVVINFFFEGERDHFKENPAKIAGVLADIVLRYLR